MPGCIYHVMHAAADITFSLLTSEFVLSPSLFFPWIQFVLSLQFVPRVRLLLDRLWLSTVCDVSSSTHHVIKSIQAFPRFSYCKRQKLGVEAWERGYVRAVFAIPPSLRIPINAYYYPSDVIIGLLRVSENMHGSGVTSRSEYSLGVL